MASDLPSTRRERLSRESDRSPASVAAPSRHMATGRPSRPGTPAPAPEHWDEHPIVLTDGSGTRRRLRAVSAAAARSGIRAGMSITEAQAQCAELEELPWDDVAIAGAVTEATAMLLEASPHVTPVRGAPGMWWVGASGFGGAPDDRGRNGLRAADRQLAQLLQRLGARWHPKTRVA